LDGAVEDDVFIGPPETPFFKAGKAARDAEVLSKSFPLILLSHGTGGLSLQMGWLGSYLASEGYIAAAVNHHGNNGLEPYQAKGFLHFWERAQDLRTVLDQLLADPQFGPRIHADQIGAAGFSLGGYTVIASAGGRTNVQTLIDAFTKDPNRDLSREIPPEFTDQAAFMQEFKSLEKYIQIADASHRDERIKAVFAIAPVLGPAFSAQGLSFIQIPVRIVVGDADPQATAGPNASHFASHIKHAELTVLEKVSHYTFLAEATDAGRQAIPMLCMDEDGIDRGAIHQKVSAWALEFFEKTLKGS
jgi:predicted dienelactone hydrolase